MFCTKCGSQIQEEEKVCPKCGTTVEVSSVETAPVSKPDEVPVQKTKSHTLKTAIKVIFAIIVVVVAIKAYSDPYRNILNVDDMREAYELAQEVVLDNISTPKSAQFPPFAPEYVTQTPTYIEYNGEEFYLYTVSAYVDFENMFGVEVRADYSCALPGTSHAGRRLSDGVRPPAQAGGGAGGTAHSALHRPGADRR